MFRNDIIQMWPVGERAFCCETSVKEKEPLRHTSPNVCRNLEKTLRLKLPKLRLVSRQTRNRKCRQLQTLQLKLLCLMRRQKTLRRRGWLIDTRAIDSVTLHLGCEVPPNTNAAQSSRRKTRAGFVLRLLRATGLMSARCLTWETLPEHVYTKWFPTLLESDRWRTYRGKFGERRKNLWWMRWWLVTEQRVLPWQSGLHTGFQDNANIFPLITLTWS